VTRRLRKVVMFLIAVALICLLWEGYKWFGTAVDGKVFGWKLPARTTDAAMPHVWDVLARFGDPERRGSSTPIWFVVLEGAWFTFRVAMVGMVVGVAVGLGLAIVMQRFVTAERGFLPFVIVSQTVPLVALAPLVVGWGGRLSLFGVDWRPWMSVSVIAAYLAFFPVAVGGLRGLTSPRPESVELMDSYAAGWWRTLVKLRLPSAVPYLVPALKLAAAAPSLSAGTRYGTADGNRSLVSVFHQPAA